MKKLFTALSALAVTMAAMAQNGTLIPAGGTYYPADANNQGYITVVYDEETAVPTASVTFNGNTVATTMEEVGFNGTTYRVAIESVMGDVTSATPFILSVGTQSAEYVYNPVFPFISAEPADGTNLSSKEDVIVFNFNQVATCDGVKFVSGDKETTIEFDEIGKSISVPLSSAYWGIAIDDINYLTVSLLNVKVDGVSISNVPGELVGTISSSYTVNDKQNVVTYLGVNEDPYWWLAQDLFGWNVTFMYNDVVSLDKAYAIITLMDKDGELEDLTAKVSTGITGSWNMRANYYAVSVPVPAFDLLEDEFVSMTIVLYGVEASQSPVSVTYDSTFPEDDCSYKVKQTHSTAGVDLVETSIANVKVYNLQGHCVLENASSENIKTLDKGIYVINGKKIVIK